MRLSRSIYISRNPRKASIQSTGCPPIDLLRTLNCRHIGNFKPFYFNVIVRWPEVVWNSSRKENAKYKPIKHIKIGRCKAKGFKTSLHRDIFCKDVIAHNADTGKNIKKSQSICPDNIARQIISGNLKGRNRLIRHVLEFLRFVTPFIGVVNTVSNKKKVWEVSHIIKNKRYRKRGNERKNLCPKNICLTDKGKHFGKTRRFVPSFFFQFFCILRHGQPLFSLILTRKNTR